MNRLHKFFLFTTSGLIVWMGFYASAAADSLLFKVNEENWEADPVNLGWIQEDSKYFLGKWEVSLPSKNSVSMEISEPSPLLDEKKIEGVNTEKIENYLKKVIAPEVERPAQDVVIDQDADGKITFNGFAMEGRRLNIPEAIQLIKKAINSPASEVHLWIDKIAPKVEVKNEALRQQGIIELVSTGETAFKGSPENRINNIQVGLNSFNGIVLPPQGELIVGKTLGRIDETTGYRKELVIKGDKTLPEFGGGLCQVSTTIYRGALFAGLPITQRRNHSYAVSYYNPQGLDATIYPPTVDLKFVNDTPHALLMQTLTTEDNHAYVNYYGTKDGREIALLGPRYYNFTPVPAARTEITTNLAPGEKQKLGEAHAGFQAAWFRQVTYTDPQKKPLRESIYSSYEARPLFYLIGAEVSTENPSGQDKTALTGNGI